MLRLKDQESTFACFECAPSAIIGLLEIKFPRPPNRLSALSNSQSSLSFLYILQVGLSKPRYELGSHQLIAYLHVSQTTDWRQLVLELRKQTSSSDIGWQISYENPSQSWIISHSSFILCLAQNLYVLPLSNSAFFLLSSVHHYQIYLRPYLSSKPGIF